MKVFRIFDEVYRREFRLIIGGIDESFHYLSRFDLGDKLLRRFRKAAYHALGTCTMGKHGEIIIWMPEFSGRPDEIATLVHELMHAYFFIAESLELEPPVGIAHSMISYVEMLVRRFLEKLSREIHYSDSKEAPETEKGGKL